MIFEFLELKEGLIGPLCLVAVIAFFVLAAIWIDVRKDKRITERRKLDRKKLEEEFSVEVKIIESVPASKNTETIKLQVNLPDGFDFDVWVVDDVDGSKREINSSCYGNSNRRICTVYKGRNMHFLVTGKGGYDSRVIKVPLET